MAYQALYRTWRPRKFADLIGQEVVTQTLQNTIESGQMTHAYLFNGPRGTGKTSAAKIFAKAVNCLHPVAGEPDGTCEICLAADQGTLGDVIELDAASNNGVDEIREIREDVNYAPTMGKYKVYIIDEVHMLSTGAFNALLKTLEEPPANVIFILATTEPQKIPATIISRTQRFDFKRIDTEAVYQRMVYILEQTEQSYEEAALRVIANAAEGGMRDALSILDQVLSFGDNAATLENALLVTGAVTQTLLGEYLQAVVAQDTPQALQKVAEILAEGKDLQRFIEDLISYARDLLLYSQAPELIQLVPNETFTALAENEAPTTWYRMIDQLTTTQQQLRFTNRPSVYVEVLTVKLSQPVVAEPQAIVAPTPQPAQPVSKPAPQPPVTESSAPAAAVAPAPQSAVEPEAAPTVNTVKPKGTVAADGAQNKGAVFGVLQEATRGDLDRIQTVWSDVVQMFSVSEQAMLNIAKPIAASPRGVVLGFDYDIIRSKVQQNQALLQALGDRLTQLSQANETRQLVLLTNELWPELRSEFVAQRQASGEGAGQRQQTTAVAEQTVTVPDPELAGMPEPAPEEADRLITAATDLFDQQLIETLDD